jgi:hypothetical protein
MCKQCQAIDEKMSQLEGLSAYKPDKMAFDRINALIAEHAASKGIPSRSSSQANAGPNSDHLALFRALLAPLD